MARTHINVMESLVYAEIERQLKFYPKNLRSYLNTVEVATYALNRLPPLYASSKMGQEQQRRLGERQYREQILSVVRRAIAAVERDPLRSSTPIVSDLEMQYEEAKQTLYGVQELLQDYNLLEYPNQVITWSNCLGVLKKAFQRLTKTQSRLTTPPPPPPLPAPSRSQRIIDQKGTLW
ncbi:MAG: late competence development ComFB family protein [Cyanobacteriota bacterium]|nr:late competence development ComFB family protein [Cyanobacteriota bacterium]